MKCDRMNNNEIVYGLGRIVNMLKCESWKEKYPDERQIIFSSAQSTLIILWLDEVRHNLTNMFLSNYFLLNESGDETLKNIILELAKNKREYTLTEYELIFIAFWLYRVRKGLKNDLIMNSSDYELNEKDDNLYKEVILGIKDTLDKSEHLEILGKIIENF